MKADVFIELPASPGALMRIAVRRDGGLKEVSPDTFRGSAQTKAVAFAPALAVSRFEVPISARSEADAKRAALYTLEDEIAQPIEDVHVTLSPRSGNKPDRVVFVVDKSLLDDWTGQLRRLGLGHAPIVPENSFVPAEPTIYRFENRWLLAGTNRVLGADGELSEAALEALTDAAELTGARMVHRGALDCLSEMYQKDAGIPLAGSGKVSKAGGNKSGFGVWRLAASLASAAVLLWTGSVWIETSRLEKAAAQSQQSAVSTFRTLFPSAPEPVNVHTEVRQQMERSISSGGGRFRILASALYKAIAEGESVQLVRLSYAQIDPRLQARLVFASRQSEQAFRASLENSGFNVEMVSASDMPQGVEVNIIISVRP